MRETDQIDDESELRSSVIEEGYAGIFITPRQVDCEALDPLYRIIEDGKRAALQEIEETK